MNRTIRIAAHLGVVAGILSLGACEPSSTETLVARAGDYELTVAEAVEILGPRRELPNQPGVVSSLADLWVDYTLLADAYLRDSAFAGVDVSEIVERQVEGRLITALRDSAVSADTTLTDAELRRLFEEEQPGIQLSARHILMGYPDQPTEAQKDSVREIMSEVLARIRAGEDFAELARTFSQDRGSGAAGGDLGEFGRGEMVRPFEEAAFALEPGEVSDLVETPFGLHIIRVDQRAEPRYEDVAPTWRIQVIAQRYQEAESLYVAGLEADANPEVQEGAVALVRDLATNRPGRLSPRAAARTLVDYQGGTVTVDEFLAFLDTRPAQTRQQIQDAPEEVIIDQLLMPLAQRELFIREARSMGLEPGEAVRDSIATEFRTGFTEASRILGLDSLAVPEGGTRVAVVDSAVTSILSEIVGNEREVLPLGPVAFTLRRNAQAELFEAGLRETVARIQEIRGVGGTPAGPPASRPGTAPPAAGDTAGRGGAGGGG